MMADQRTTAGPPRQSQQYIPKLSYRNTFNESSDPSLRWSLRTESTSRTDGTSNTILTTPTSPAGSDYLPSPRSPQFSLGTSRSPSGLSDASQQDFPWQKPHEKSAKKKSSSFFKFLSVKEPSTQAWLDYQQSLRKQGVGQNKDTGRVSAVGLPMVSSARLPSTVPKVNSKWDGVPESIKEKEKRLKAMRRESTYSQEPSPSVTIENNLSRTSSLVSLRSKLSSRAGRSAIYDSSSASARSASPFGSSSTSSSSDIRDFAGTRASSLQSCSITALSDTTSYLSADIPAPPEIPEIYRKQMPPRCADKADVPSHSPSPSLTPTDPSPSTPPPSSPLFPLGFEGKYPESLAAIFDPAMVEMEGNSSDRAFLRPAGNHVLSPPSEIRRYAKASPSALSEKPNNKLTAKTESQPQSILKNRMKSLTAVEPSRPPLSPYSATVKIGSEDRPSTSRDRLGLGMGFKISPSIAPWESLQSEFDAQISKKSVTQTPTRGNWLKRSKMSTFGAA